MRSEIYTSGMALGLKIQEGKISASDESLEG